MEKGSFEKALKNTFEGAEAAPSDAVWTKLELDLEKEAGGIMRQRLLVYKLLAAASLVSVMITAGIYYRAKSDAILNETASRDATLSNSAVNQNNAMDNQNSETKFNRSTDEKFSEPKNLDKTNSGNVQPAQPITFNRNAIVLSDKPKSDNIISEVTPITPVQLPYFNLFEGKPNSNLAKIKIPQLIFPTPQSNADPGMVLLSKLHDEEKKYAEEDKHERTSSENLWTSVGFAAGSFNPNTPGTSTTAFNQVTNTYTTVASDPTAGLSYSLGVQVGGKIANRVVLFGGVSYLVQNASYTSNMGSIEAASIKAALSDYALPLAGNAISTSPYNVNNNLQYVSVPVQAGYVVLDRKFAIQINGGFATDFFMQNTLTPDSESVDKVSQGPGADSPYRPVNFSGLMGTEFSYKFSDRYRLALNPGFRYALNSIYKTDISTEVAPITYDVAFRFRYIFR